MRQPRCSAPGCRRVIEQPATGRPRETCSDACRARKARRAKRRSVHFSSATCEWATPQDLFDELDAQYRFELDVCATPENAKCARYFTRDDDGLAQTWEGICWCNPPYGREIGRWVRKAWEAAQAGATVVCLVPARTDTTWWHEYASKGEIVFLRGRVKFGEAAAGAPFPSALVAFRDASAVTKHPPKAASGATI